MTVAILGTVVAYVVARRRVAIRGAGRGDGGVCCWPARVVRAGRAPMALGSAAGDAPAAEPAMIGDAGFRLSVMATAGLLAWANPLAARLGRVGGGRLPGWLAESLGISLAAEAATLPDVLATFGRIVAGLAVVNLAVVPLVPAAMLGGVVAMLAGGAAMLGAPPVLATRGRPARLAGAARDRDDRPDRGVAALRGADAAAGCRRAGRVGHRGRDPPRADGLEPRASVRGLHTARGPTVTPPRRRHVLRSVGRPRIGRPSAPRSRSRRSPSPSPAALSDAAGQHKDHRDGRRPGDAILPRRGPGRGC